MKFSAEDIKKYQDLCRKYFNEEVDEATAAEEINNLMFMLNLMYHPQIQQHLSEAVNKEEAGAGHRKQSGPLSKNS